MLESFLFALQQSCNICALALEKPKTQGLDGVGTGAEFTMTINDKHQGSSEKHLEGQKSGDQQVAGKPITDKHDNAQQQRLEQLSAAKAFRFTKDGGNAFTIDMGEGKAVQDKRPIQDSSATRDLVPSRMDEKTGQVDVLGKDGKWHKSGQHSGWTRSLDRRISTRQGWQLAQSRA
jgi:hypothetical protein